MEKNWGDTPSATLKKAGILFSTCWRNIGQSVDQTVSCQLFFIPLFDCYKTWYSGFPWRGDDPYWFFRSRQRLRSDCWSSFEVLPAYYIITFLFIFY